MKPRTDAKRRGVSVGPGHIHSRRGDGDQIVCVNEPYDAAYSIKHDERDLRGQGKAHVHNPYTKLAATKDGCKT